MPIYFEVCAIIPPLSMCQMHGAFLLLMARDRVRVEKQEGKIDCCVFVSISVLSENTTSSCPSRQERTCRVAFFLCVLVCWLVGVNFSLPLSSLRKL